MVDRPFPSRIAERVALAIALACAVAHGCAKGSESIGAGAAGGQGGAGAVAGGSGGATATTTSTSTSTSTSGAMVCVPGKQEACACPGGVMGAQACNAAGSGYEPCDCPASSSSSSSSTSGSSSSSTSSSTSASSSSSTSSSTSASSSSSSSSTSASSSSSSTSSTGSSSSGGVGADNCPGQPLTLVGGTVTVNDDTSQYAGDFAGYCTNVTQEIGGDVVYRVVAVTTGTMTITVKPTGFSAVISVTTGTCNGNASRSCSWGVNVGATTTRMVSVVAGTTYYVYVDGWSLSGPFSMTITN